MESKEEKVGYLLGFSEQFFGGAALTYVLGWDIHSPAQKIKSVISCEHKSQGQNVVEIMNDIKT